MNANVSVSFGVRAAIAYLPLVPVSVAMLVPLTTTLAPESGLPSLAEVTVPVTCTGAAWPQPGSTEPERRETRPTRSDALNGLRELRLMANLR